jgi:homoserine O-acetyltransferase
MGEQESVGIVQTQHWRFAEPPNELELRCGQKLGPIDVAYETYGELTPERDNAIYICHALSGDAHVAGRHEPDDGGKPWWNLMVGPGKPIDTDRFFVVCSNFLGGCRGTTGPSSINPKSGRPYGLDFPMITVQDMVKVQHALLTDHLGLDCLLCVVGGSLGGMQVLRWAIDYPDMVHSAMPVATTSRLNAQGISFDEVGRQAIYSDPNWNGGDYYDGDHPHRGLALARMVGHITYLSDQSMHERFGRRLQERETVGYDFGPPDFQVESYLRHKGDTFVQRFDANSYLYITKAMDYFDLERDYDSLVAAFHEARSRFLVISFTSDWLFPTYQSRAIVRALVANGARVSFCEVESSYGHDAFLLPSPTMEKMIRDFLSNSYRELRAAAGGRS